MAMNYFAFFPALLNEAINPNAANTGFFANPPGPDGDQFAALGGQGISIVSYRRTGRSEKFLEWFIKDETQQQWADLGGYTASAAVLGSDEFLQCHALQRGVLPDHVQVSRTSGRCRSMPTCCSR